MDLFEQLRREHEFGIGTIAGVAAKFGVHRRVVRRAIASALPPPHQYPGRSKPKLGALEAFIDEVLDEDCGAPRKQRHTARRIYRRILTECPDAVVAESTVRNHVRERKHQMGLLRRETFVPQSYSLAQEAQVDWYEAWIDLDGVALILGRPPCPLARPLRCFRRYGWRDHFRVEPFLVGAPRQDVG